MYMFALQRIKFDMIKFDQDRFKFVFIKVEKTYPEFKKIVYRYVVLNVCNN